VRANSALLRAAGKGGSRESVWVRRRGWFAEFGPIPGWVRQLQPHGEGIVWQGFAVNDMRARMEMAGEGSNGNILIGRPGAFR
jgi:hypothetical protein